MSGDADEREAASEFDAALAKTEQPQELQLPLANTVTDAGGRCSRPNIQ